MLFFLQTLSVTDLVNNPAKRFIKHYFSAPLKLVIACLCLNSVGFEGSGFILFVLFILFYGEILDDSLSTEILAGANLILQGIFI